MVLAYATLAPFSDALSQIIEDNFMLPEWTVHKPQLEKKRSGRRSDPIGRSFSEFHILNRVVRKYE